MSMSRLDRFLLSDSWVSMFPNCIQMALPRSLSDHCPLLLTIDDENWGPKPLRMLQCWSEIPDYGDFVKDKWQSIQVQGWRGFILATVWDCDNFKSPGPDGIHLGFFKEFWEILKVDLLNFFAEFYHNDKLTKGLNSTFIALIPKVDNPQRMVDFRPISLVSSVYKILSKVLANRLRRVVGHVVSGSQSAFIKGRQILDGILIANELVDDAKCKKKYLLLFKVNFEKAYVTIMVGYGS